MSTPAMTKTPYMPVTNHHSAIVIITIRVGKTSKEMTKIAYLAVNTTTGNFQRTCHATACYRFLSLLASNPFYAHYRAP